MYIYVYIYMYIYLYRIIPQYTIKLYLCMLKRCFKFV